MTTLGKILVFLVFLGALAMGGLMIYVAKTTPNWKVAVEERDEYIKVLKANVQAQAESQKKWLQEYENTKKLLDSALIESKGMQIRLKRDADDQSKEVQDALLMQKKSDLNHKQAQAEATRLQKELLFMQGVVQDREAKILDLQKEIVTAKNNEQAARNIAETATARAVGLLDQVREKEATIAKLTQKNQPSAVSVSVRDPNYSNPPTVKVEGRIIKVHAEDKKLVEISVGTDQGVQKDQTLEVFRMSPKAEYLGRLLIVNTDFRSAVGRLMPTPGVQGTVTLLPGDEVAGKLR